MRHRTPIGRVARLGVFTLAAGCSGPAAPVAEVPPTATPVAAQPSSESAAPANPAHDAVRAGLKATSAEQRVQAIRQAMDPAAGLLAEIGPLLDDPDPMVRRAAVLAVGPAPDPAAAVVPVEELFRRLGDPDADVRELTVSVLRSRGLNPVQVDLARKMVSADPADRLQLLVDLAVEVDAVPDAGPWLEQLSRDPEPAVRAGAARVAVERRLTFVGWLDRLAEHDADPTVRRQAGYYRQVSKAVRPAGYADR